jgi:hypothetical protein
MYNISYLHLSGVGSSESKCNDNVNNIFICVLIIGTRSHFSKHNLTRPFAKVVLKPSPPFLLY